MVRLAPCKRITMVHLCAPWQEAAVRYLKWSDGCEEQITTDADNKQVSEASNPKRISFQRRTRLWWQPGKEGIHTERAERTSSPFQTEVQKERRNEVPIWRRGGRKPNQGVLFIGEDYVPQSCKNTGEYKNLTDPCIQKVTWSVSLKRP